MIKKTKRRNKRVSHKRVSHKRVSRKRVSHKRVSCKRVSHKRVSHKRVSHKRVSHKRFSHKRVSHKRVSCKRVSRKRKGGGNDESVVQAQAGLEESHRDLAAAQASLRVAQASLKDAQGEYAAQRLSINPVYYQGDTFFDTVPEDVIIRQILHPPGATDDEGDTVEAASGITKDTMKENLEQITGKKWTDISNHIVQQGCMGAVKEFFMNHLNKLIKKNTILKKENFFLVFGDWHQYIIYDEDGEEGRVINISEDEGWEKRFIIDGSQNFIGYLKDGFKPVEDAMAPLLAVGSRKILKYSSPVDWWVEDVR
jgi:hypothetical protein